MFERLHSELKNKSKELVKGAGKGSKAVDKSRQATQKHIELLGQHTATFDSSGGNIKAADDPYILQRGVMHRLNKQVIEENNNRNDLLAVQNSFSAFEAHIIQTIQQGMSQFYQVVSKQSDLTKANYGDMVGVTQRMPPDFEWQGFVKRNNSILIDPSSPQRTVSNIGFPNQGHRSTQPLIAGSLDRKAKIMRKFDTAFYVVTPSKYLHEFKTNDDFGKAEPSPELSLFLPDCSVGAVDGLMFNVKGKDASKGSLGAKLSMAHEYGFKAHTAKDAEDWHRVVSECAGQTTAERPLSEPSSPVTGRKEGAVGEGFGREKEGYEGASAEEKERAYMVQQNAEPEAGGAGGMYADPGHVGSSAGAADGKAGYGGDTKTGY